MESTTYTVPEAVHALRADKALAGAFTEHSRTALQRAFDAGLVKLGGAAIKRDRIALELTPAQTVESARRLQAWTQPATPSVQGIVAAMYPGGAEVVEQIANIVAPPAPAPVLEALAPASNEPMMEPEMAAMEPPPPPAVATAPVEVVTPVAISPLPPAVPAGPPLRILPR